MNFKLLIPLIALLLIILLLKMFRDKESDIVFDEAKETIIMREIGHKLLIHSGDSTSRVLPVKQTRKNEYLLQFESPFTFDPDSLVKVIAHSIKSGRLPQNYIVNVIECSSSEIVFGYAILETERNNIVPCTGREQPKKCYTIKIMFPGPQGADSGKHYYLIIASLLAIPLLAFTKRLYVKRKKTENIPPVAIGKYLFYPERQHLANDSGRIELTAKESKLLNIFASNLNVVIDRNRLLKEVWEDEGVIVGRSLDMFISKLRKKLRGDSSIKFVNIHGKGYKLEVNQTSR